jgi:hypothetical protein
MWRYGLGTVHQAMLTDILGIGSRSGHTLVQDAKTRARLILQLVEVSRGTLSASIALAEAEKLV